MVWRRCELLHPAEEIFIVTWDVWERDIGYEEGRRAREHFRISHHPNAGKIDDLEPAVTICSCEMSAGIRSQTPSQHRAPSFWDRHRRRGKRPT